MLTIFAVSDGTGRTAAQLVRAALAQFEGAEVEVIERGGVRAVERLREVVAEARRREAVLCHTLVSHSLREAMLVEARAQGVDAHDMMGPVLDRIAQRLNISPRQMPGLMKHLLASKSREIEAVEFAFHHDDGQHVEDLKRAEVVLVGVSRTKKTPTTLYLAYRGWFAANVPLVPDIPPPEELTALPAGRVFCLMIAPERLKELRRSRAQHERIPAESYLADKQILREIRYAEQLCDRHGWERIDATGRPVEEIAREIVALLPKRRRRAE
jgi:[pyruvate, water dikinase]-phosphate phosphotransferase / [pyruvate, water dikinase] kinase